MSLFYEYLCCIGKLASYSNSFKLTPTTSSLALVWEIMSGWYGAWTLPRISKPRNFSALSKQPLWYGEKFMKMEKIVSVNGSDLPLPHHRHALETNCLLNHPTPSHLSIQWPGYISTPAQQAKRMKHTVTASNKWEWCKGKAESVELTQQYLNESS